ncbi:MAG: hypothetical protein JWR74_2150, partial [Polaromonas sp.]|nr:hypothetical protein [Polaromonas sp.]
RWKQLRDLASAEKSSDQGGKASIQGIIDRALKEYFDRLGQTLAD